MKYIVLVLSILVLIVLFLSISLAVAHIGQFTWIQIYVKFLFEYQTYILYLFGIVCVLGLMFNVLMRSIKVN